MPSTLFTWSSALGSAALWLSALGLSALGLAATSASAQTPSEPWRTIRTEHFRVHYPVAAAAWSEDAAGRLEAWHERVVDEVGWAPQERTDVVVIDPYSDANGAAFPFTRAPRMVLYATPPDAASTIGQFRSWSETLLVHEDAHLVHLLRPPRNALGRFVAGITGFGPVALKSPRWVVEGYATVVEGRLSGSGRPNSDARALHLRQLAQTGQMPSYAELSGSGRWSGGSFAYQVGSAWLEWLEARAGDGALRDLWARMSARKVRTFDDAFVGVFGAPPAELYGRYVAELTADAIAVEEAVPVDEEPFLRIGWSVGAPAVSPDGTRVAAPVFPQRGLPRVDVWDIEVDAEAVAKREEAEQQLLARDPEDVLPVHAEPDPHRRAARRRHATFAAREIRWLPDGSGLLLSAWSRDRTGRLRPDLFRWDQARNRTRRVTRRADVMSADPAPDGAWAAAVQLDWGQTRIVRVDLETGAVQPITPFGLARVDAPRVSPDGERLAWLCNDGDGFAVVVRHLASGAEWRSAPSATGEAPMSLAWGRDGRSLLGSAGAGGRIEVHELWRDGARGRGRLSHTAGGALFADPIDDGRVIALSTSYRGRDLHEVPLAPPEGEAVAWESKENLALPPAPPDAPPLPEGAPVEPRRYGLGPLDLSPIAALALVTAAEQGHGEVGVRAGDLVGRWEWLMVGAYGSDSGGTTGGRAALTLNVLPVQIGVDGYVGGDNAYASRRAGVAVELADGVRGAATSASARLAAVTEQPMAGDRVGPRRLLYGSGGVGWLHPRSAALGLGLGVRAAAGTTGGVAFQQVVAHGKLQALRKTPLVLAYDAGTSSGRSLLDRFALGGIEATVTVDPANLWRVYDPVYAAGAIRGARFDKVSVSLGRPWAVFAQRQRFGFRLGEQGTTAVGVRADLALDRQPVARVPALRGQAGVACRVEWPGQGFVRNACLHLGDYSAWAGFRWER
jgi:hypothetical protein